MVLSELPHLMSPFEIVQFENLSVGDVVDEARIVKADNKHGVFLELLKGIKAFAPVSNMYMLHH